MHETIAITVSLFAKYASGPTFGVVLSGRAGCIYCAAQRHENVGDIIWW